MRLGTSLLLIAIGAVLRWAVTATTTGVNIHTVGVILMVVGAVGFVISLYWMLVVSDNVRSNSVSRRSYAQGSAPRDTRPPEAHV
jgi:beta-lactamase regulating signal transducer with metallopeptidase domain